MSEAFYDKQYNPRLSIPDAMAYFERWQAEGKRVRLTDAARWDLQFGSDPDETLDFYPAQSSSSPLLIFVHGGYWRMMHKNDFAWLPLPFVAQGVSVANINYTLAPQIGIDGIVRQVRKAVAWLYQNHKDLGFDPGRVVCAGHSAGGHLAAMLLTENEAAESAELLPTVVAISGLFDLDPLMRATFLRDAIKLDEDQIRDLSPANLRPVPGSRILTAVGELESAEFHRQSTLLAERWGNSTVSDHVVVEGAHHFDVCDLLTDGESELFNVIMRACSA